MLSIFIIIIDKDVPPINLVTIVTFANITIDVSINLIIPSLFLISPSFLKSSTEKNLLV